MDWIEITVETSGQGVEPVSALVLAAGIAGLVVDDPQDIRNLLADPRAARWDYVEDELLRDLDRSPVIRVYVAADEQGRRQWADLRRSLAGLRAADGDGLYGSLTWRLKDVRDEDWANNWKAYFKPFTVGERLVVKPSWESWAGQDGRLILEIDPGSSFGSGQHHTTRLCLEMLEKYTAPGMRLLDVGCGSGILMIAGLLLGAATAVGVDVEEHALHTARENLAQNQIAADRFALYAGDLTEDEELARRLLGRPGSPAPAARPLLPAAGEGAGVSASSPGSAAGGGAGRFHLITANIVADVILGLTPRFAGLLEPAGVLLISGIIAGRRPEVAAKLEEAGFVLAESRESGEWYGLCFRLRTSAESELPEGF